MLVSIYVGESISRVFLAVKLPFEMGTFTNSVDPDEMPHNAAFHQGLHCLLRQYQSSEKENQCCFSTL